MTGPRIARVCLFLLTLLFPLGVQSLTACEIPPDLLTGRSLSETWKILEGEVVFVADAQLHDFEGRTSAISGLVMARELADAVGCVAIGAKDLDTGIRRRNEIMWKDHLEVTEYPEIRFTLTGLTDVRKEAERVGLMLEGELMLHGVPQRLRIPATVSTKNGMFEVEGKTTLKMSDHAIERPSLLFFTVEDEVDVRFRVLVGEGT
ncbi:MAG: YceI family protein [Candidatus Methylomirabilales bacterium]